MSYFNIIDQTVAERVEQPFIRSVDEPDRQWDYIDVWHVIQWNAALKRLHLWLYLAGYRPEYVRFRVPGEKFAVIDLDARHVYTHSYAEPQDVTIGFSALALSDGSTCAVPFEDGPVEFGDELDQDLPSNLRPSMSIEPDGTGELKFSVFASFEPNNHYHPADPDYQHDDPAKPLAGVLFLELLSRVAHVLEVHIADRLRDIWEADYATPEQDAADREEAGEGESLPDGNWRGKRGLFWLLDPANWRLANQQDTTTLVGDVAAKIWKGLARHALDDKLWRGSPEVQLSAEDLRDYAALAGRIFGVHRHRERKFFDALLDHLDRYVPDFPVAMAQALNTISYLEVLMLLANYEVIAVEALGDVERASILEDEALFDFAELSDDLGAFALLYREDYEVRLSYEHELLHETGHPKEGQPYRLDQLVCWEFFEANQDDPEDRARINRLVIVAAPGIAISVPPQRPTDLNVQIIRVQDPVDVPPIFSAIDVQSFYQPWQDHFMPPDIRVYVPDEQGEEKLQWSHYLDAFVLTPVNDKDGDVVGLKIEYPATNVTSYYGNELFKISLTLTVDKYASDQRFTHDIFKLSEPYTNFRAIFSKEINSRLKTHFHLIVHHTEGVESEMKYYNPAIEVYDTKYPQHTVRYYLYEAQSKTASLDAINFTNERHRFKDSRRSVLWHVPYARYQQSDGAIISDGQWWQDSFIKYIDDTLASWWAALTGAPSEEDVPEKLKPYKDGFFFSGESETEETDLDLKDGRPLYLDLLKTTNIGDESKNSAAFRLDQSRVTLGKYTDEDWHLDRIAVDVAIGFIPFVGDAADIAEMTTVMVTGRDKWGQPVSGGEFLLMAGCAALPFVGTGVAKAFVKGTN